MLHKFQTIFCAILTKMQIDVEFLHSVCYNIFVYFLYIGNLFIIIKFHSIFFASCPDLQEVFFLQNKVEKIYVVWYNYRIMRIV